MQTSQTEDNAEPEKNTLSEGQEELLKIMDQADELKAVAASVNKHKLLSETSESENGEPTEQGWSVECYYVNEDDRYNVVKTDDFNLKYQIEMHVDRNIAPGELKIKLPAALFILREGLEQDDFEWFYSKYGDRYDYNGDFTEQEFYPLYPADIAVPYGDPSVSYETTNASDFNYYLEFNTETWD